MRSLRVVIIGGGPAGLFLGRLLKLADPATDVVIYERHGPDDAFGFGVVFSDRTMSSFRLADPETYELIRGASVSWRDMEIRLPDETLRYGGYGFTAIFRRALLRILQRQADRVGVDLRFHRETGVADLGALSCDGPDVIAVADGVNSANRQAGSELFGTVIDPGTAKYIWFGTPARFDAVTFPFVATEHGAFGAHAYPYGDGMSTFIVETNERTWSAAGMAPPAAVAQEAGGTDEYARKLLSEVFADHLGGAPLLGNNSRWANFRVVRNRRWWADNVVLLGDAAHTAHFSVGSGTKLAMEDAIALAAALRDADSPSEAFTAYESVRRGPVGMTQAWAERSMRWWETFDRRLHLPPHRFGLHFVTRTGAISYAGLHRRHPDRIEDAEREFRRFATAVRPAGGSGTERGSGPSRSDATCHALQLPIWLGPVHLRNRLVGHCGGDLRRQRVLAAGFSATGCALVLVDWRPGDGFGGTGVGVHHDDRQAVAKEIADRGAVLGVVFDHERLDRRLLRSAASMGAGVVEVVLGEDRVTDERLLMEVGEVTGGAVVAGLACPPESPWSRRGGDTLERCDTLRRSGIALAHLRGAGDNWDHALDWADRIRTETGLPVLLDGPHGWAVQVSRGGGPDDWATRFHAAIVSGRVDLIAAWPLPPVGETAAGGTVIKRGGLGLPSVVSAP